MLALQGCEAFFQRVPTIRFATHNGLVGSNRRGPPGWYVGRPGPRHGGTWTIYAFDTTEKGHIGKRSREWTAVGETEAKCVRDMARCQREIGEGRAPR